MPGEQEYVAPEHTPALVQLYCCTTYTLSRCSVFFFFFFLLRRRKWADELDEEESELPPSVTTVDPEKGTRTVVSYRKNEAGKTEKVCSVCA